MNNRIFNFLKDFFNNEDIKTGYKVVRLNMNSFSKPFLFGGIKYKLNKKVFPKEGCGPLCIFDNLENIKEFFLSYNSTPINYRVIKCNYEESEEKKVWNDFEEIFLQVLPSGTKLANWVELIEEVKL